MINVIIEVFMWLVSRENTLGIISTLTSVISCVAAIATFFVALVTYNVSQISKEIAVESKQVAIESKELAEREYNLEREEPWKMTPIPNKEGYWILERVHPQLATIYTGWAWTNPPLEWLNEEEGWKDAKRLEVEFVDYLEVFSRTFSRGTKIVVKIPEVPIGSMFQLYYHEHSNLEEAAQNMDYKKWVQTFSEVKASGAIPWETPLY